MDKITVCIPTLIEYELCLRLIENIENGTQKPDEYIIIDNGGFLEECWNIKLDNLKIYNFNKNLGVSGSWNWFLNNVEGNLLIVNDDIIFEEDTLETLTKSKEKETDDKVIIHSAEYPNNFSLFLTDNSIKDKIGLFDKNFYPAYFEDNDYTYRIKLSEYKTRSIPELKFIHETSSTLIKQRELGLNKDHDKNFEKNRDYYIRKWGGLPFEEKFKYPFNEEK